LNSAQQHADSDASMLRASAASNCFDDLRVL
jgi:hypothetical protein